MKNKVYNNSGEIFGIDINEMGMFNYDIAVVIVFLTISLFWKEQRNLFLIGAGLYLFFTLFWHMWPWE
jgi:hypothetical protein|tara:strand:- start:212 stop:415 length:204 start_codon:yes stop_codon:yes gene_type:complete